MKSLLLSASCFLLGFLIGRALEPVHATSPVPPVYPALLFSHAPPAPEPIPPPPKPAARKALAKTVQREAPPTPPIPETSAPKPPLITGGQRQQLTQCFRAATFHSGRFVVTVKTSSDGSVRAVKTFGDEFLTPAERSCLIQAVRGWSFAPPVPEEIVIGIDR